MNTMTGATEVSDEKDMGLEETPQLCSSFPGYAVAVGNFNNDDNQGRVAELSARGKERRVSLHRNCDQHTETAPLSRSSGNLEQ